MLLVDKHLLLLVYLYKLQKNRSHLIAKIYCTSIPCNYFTFLEVKQVFYSAKKSKFINLTSETSCSIIEENWMKRKVRLSISQKTRVKYSTKSARRDTAQQHVLGKDLTQSQGVQGIFKVAFGAAYKKPLI